MDQGAVNSAISTVEDAIGNAVASLCRSRLFSQFEQPAVEAALSIVKYSIVEATTSLWSDGI